VEAGQKGRVLVAAVAQALLDQDRLEFFSGHWPEEFLKAFPPLPCVESPEAGCWLQVGQDRWNEWTPEVVLTLYTELGGARLEQTLTLDLWLLAVGGEVGRYWELQQNSLSRPIMASLVERGANPLRALRLLK